MKKAAYATWCVVRDLELVQCHIYSSLISRMLSWVLIFAGTCDHAIMCTYKRAYFKDLILASCWLTAKIGPLKNFLFMKKELKGKKEPQTTLPLLCANFDMLKQQEPLKDVTPLSSGEESGPANYRNFWILAWWLIPGSSDWIPFCITFGRTRLGTRLVCAIATFLLHLHSIIPSTSPLIFLEAQYGTLCLTFLTMTVSPW